MPDLVGKGVRVARRALPSDTSITVKDGTGDGRLIIVDTNWRVCATDPAPGAPFDGEPVTLTAVKTGEDC